MNYNKMVNVRLKDRVDNHSRQLPQSTFGEFLELNGENFYCIHNSQHMPGFFMSLSGAGDHWMFVSSEGAVTAGRACPLGAYFPYYSADKIADMQHCTGPRTIIRVPQDKGAVKIWEPFKPGLVDAEIARHVYKNDSGSKLIFEEINHELGLLFRYQWAFGLRFGFIRTCQLTNLSAANQTLSVLDGLENIMPAGLDDHFQNRFSNLGDAYKKNELLSGSGLGIFFLNSVPTDRAEPSEGLRSNVAWHYGCEAQSVLISSDQIPDFCRFGRVSGETEQRARRGAYLVHHVVELSKGDTADWGIVGDSGLDTTDVLNLNCLLEETSNVSSLVSQDIRRSQDKFEEILAAADGFQAGGIQHVSARHKANVLFNIMRGGLPAENYEFEWSHFESHLVQFNQSLAQRHAEWLADQSAEGGGRGSLFELLEKAESTGDQDLTRIASEYLPLTFSRRHGDPTRPWNRFAIKAFSDDGQYQIDYQGNWRDIFQNWEALLLSWPRLASGMVCRFLNASTADGYNPYRLTMSGFEWEVPDPEDPWSNIGYWGDHQIVYLHRLLQWAGKFSPDSLERRLDQKAFVFAEIPYRIRGYQDILKDPFETIDYDVELEKQIERRSEAIGSDGKLIQGSNGEPFRVGLLEKLLLPALVKMSNFVPGGGIWLNTQRPEWNDANNALVGYGLSVVTVCHLRSYFAYLKDWLQDAQEQQVEISVEVAGLLQRISAVLKEHHGSIGSDDPQRRKAMVDALSKAGSDYRDQIYDKGFCGEFTALSLTECAQFASSCLDHLDQTVRQSRREDGLYHSYNLLCISEQGMAIEPLFEMLEGQVAVLSSGLLSPEQSLDVLKSLRNSAMYRDNQSSYMLYPDREVARFIEKNHVSQELLKESPLARRLVEDQRGVLRRDVRGDLHFAGDFRNVGDLNVALDKLAEDAEFRELVAADRDVIAGYFGSTFGHRRFIGRSTSFFGYEGLGSIYWHMVSKLCLAAQESFLRAVDADANPSVISGLRSCYREIRDGIARKKSPSVYGAFPTDPYSHTPASKGAQQPGMTGQVKEDILVRFGELGIRVDDGCLSFDATLLEDEEFLSQPAEFDLVGLGGRRETIRLPESSLAFTFCQVPVVVHRLHSNSDSTQKYRLTYRAGHVAEHPGATLSIEESASLFARDGSIARIDIFLTQYPS